jgi:N-acetylmuramoyl-L-alanine amidase
VLTFSHSIKRRKPAVILLLFVIAASPATGKLTPMGTKPDWGELDAYQQTITRKEFLDLLERVYAPGGTWRDVITVHADRAEVKTVEGKAPWVLRFASSRADAIAVPAKWRSRAQLPPPGAKKPLEGLRIAIDPGHIGGKWAKMEERWFRVGKARPVTEGDMTLLVAKKLAGQLGALGAKVSLTREKAAPTTSDRPEKLTNAARASLAERGARVTQDSLRREANKLFYRASEIRKRADLVNNKIRPDLVLCLHFNAEAWGNENRPRLVKENHLHFLVTGAWSARELAYEDQRFEMLMKLLGRTFPEELAVTKAVQETMVRDTGLPPFTYKASNAVKVSDSPYIWGRNLLANRLFRSPTVYLEPYVMNSRSVHARIQAGDYAGVRTIDGAKRKSIYREYADAVVAGLVNYYSVR